MTTILFMCKKENKQRLAETMEFSTDLGDDISENGLVDLAWKTVLLLTCSECKEVTEIRL